MVPQSSWTGNNEIDMNPEKFKPEHFKWSYCDGIATICLDRPKRKNPLTFESYAELRDCFRDLVYTKNVKVVVFAPNGGNFSSGGDVHDIIGPLVNMEMTELLDLYHSDNVLEIGTGSGYQLAVLSQIVDFCYSIEIKESLANNAREKLNSLGYNNVKIKYGDGYKGWKEYAPFDKIILTAAPVEIPSELINQLKDGGLMVLPVGEKNNQELIVLRKKGNKLIKEDIIPVRFVPMIHMK